MLQAHLSVSQTTAIIVRQDLAFRIEGWHYNSTFFLLTAIKDIVVMESDKKPVITPTNQIIWQGLCAQDDRNLSVIEPNLGDGIDTWHF